MVINRMRRLCFFLIHNKFYMKKRNPVQGAFLILNLQVRHPECSTVLIMEEFPPAEPPRCHLLRVAVRVTGGKWGPPGAAAGIRQESQGAKARGGRSRQAGGSV